MATKGKTASWILIAALMAAFVITSVVRFGNAPKEKSFQDYLGFFREVVALVKTDYVEKVDNKKLMESAIGGMLAALDPHNAYLPPESFKEMQIQMSGSFGGVGIEITMKDNRLTVISPIEDTPAYRAGIKPGDYIWKIDNSLTRNMEIADAVKRMRGPQGTRVSLTIAREGVDRPLFFHLKRENIRIRSVKYRDLSEGYGYIRIAQFQEKTGEEFVRALRELHRKNGGTLRGLVLDLRNNPGGLVDSAVEVAGRFMGEGLQDSLVVSMKGRDPSSQKELSATIGEKEPHYPIVVLINNGSASASEIVAGALQDYKRAVIMGTQSFGKGSVQSVIPMKGGAALKLTTARYFTPKGRSIQARGITPDIIVDPAEKAEPVKENGIDIREADLDGHIEPGGGEKIKQRQGKQGLPHPVAGKSAAAEDYQLFRALDLLKGINLLEKRK